MNSSHMNHAGDEDEHDNDDDNQLMIIFIQMYHSQLLYIYIYLFAFINNICDSKHRTMCHHQTQQNLLHTISIFIPSANVYM